MKASEMRTKSESQLTEELKNLKETLFHLRFQLAINQLENPMRIKEVKKDIARVKTVLCQIERNNAADDGAKEVRQ